jgi:ribonuclease HI
MERKSKFTIGDSGYSFVVLVSFFVRPIFMSYIMYSDGGSRGNPGPAAIGTVILDEAGVVLHEISQAIGITTNNQAEYRALLAGVQWVVAQAGDRTLHCFLDSELVVKQMNREYKIKDPGLAQLWVEINRLASQLDSITFTHVRREYNKHADRLVNQALDQPQ